MYQDQIYNGKYVWSIFVISAKFVPLKFYTLSSQLQRLTSFSVGCSGRRILPPGQIAVMRKWSIGN